MSSHMLHKVTLQCLKPLIVAAVVLASFVLPPAAKAQRVAIKTNALEYLVLEPNLTLEARLNRCLSLQVGFSCNPITRPIGGYSVANFRVEPELRYWFNRPMARHFVALSATAATYNCRFNDRRIQGDMVAAGLSYGYALVLSKHWNMEAELGVGVGSFSAYNYFISNGKPAAKNYRKILPMAIRCGLNFCYIF